MELMKISEHGRIDRVERITRIITELGIGEIVLTIEHREMKRLECLTSTGVILIKSSTDNVVITAYVASIDRVIAMYKSQGYTSIPTALRNKVRKNKPFQQSLRGM
jgi:hypothetical protein